MDPHTATRATFPLMRTPMPVLLSRLLLPYQSQPLPNCHMMVDLTTITSSQSEQAARALNGQKRLLFWHVVDSRLRPMIMRHGRNAVVHRNVSTRRSHRLQHLVHLSSIIKEPGLAASSRHRMTRKRARLQTPRIRLLLQHYPALWDQDRPVQVRQCLSSAGRCPEELLRSSRIPSQAICGLILLGNTKTHQRRRKKVRRLPRVVLASGQSGAIV